MPRSALFRRNNSGIPKKPYPKRAPRVYNRAAPSPPKSKVAQVNTQEQKVLNGSGSALTLKDSGQCFHLDQITQGVGASQRLGQKHKVTGVHLRGQWALPSGVHTDCVGYMLFWDRQPNEVLANPADILRISGTDSVRCFPNVDNAGRFVPLGRKQFTSSNASTNGTTGLQVKTESSDWNIDDFWDFSTKNLVATQVLAGDGLIGDRTSGALILLGIGGHAAASSANMNFNFRVFFEDV